MMKKILYAFMLLVAVSACQPKEEEEPLSVVGQWQLVNVATKAAMIGSTSVEVYIDFRESGQFVLYQTLGEGRPRAYDGSYELLEDQLSGRYTDGTKWATTYTVAKSGSNITLTSASGNETDTYQPTTIPQSVIDSAF